MLRAIIGYPTKWLGFTGMGASLLIAALQYEQNGFIMPEVVGGMFVGSYLTFRLGKWIANKPVAEKPEADTENDYKIPSDIGKDFLAAETDEEREDAMRRAHSDYLSHKITKLEGKACPWQLVLLAWFLLGIPFTSNLLPGIDERVAGIGYYLLDNFGVPQIWNLGIGFGVLAILMIICHYYVSQIESLRWQAMTPEQKRRHNERVDEKNREFHIKEAERKTLAATRATSASQAHSLRAEAETHRLRAMTQ